MDVKKIESELRGKSYAELAEEMDSFDDNLLIGLLDSRSTRIGDTAADILSRRGKEDTVVDNVLAGRVSTKFGKIRSISILCGRGRKCGRGLEAYLSLLRDKNGEVVEDALFALVFLQEKQQINGLTDVMTSLPPGSELRKQFELAIESLEKEDPFIYSPYFHDAGNVWGLDPKKFGDRIGMPGKRE